MSTDRDRVALAVLWLNGVVMGFHPAGSYHPPLGGRGTLQPHQLVEAADDDTTFELWIPGEPPRGGVIPLTREQWTALAGQLRPREGP